MDDLLVPFGLLLMPFVRQMFFQKKNHLLSLLVAWIVDNLLLTRPIHFSNSLIPPFNTMFMLGAIKQVPGHLRFFRLNIVRYADSTTEADANDPLEDMTSVQYLQYADASMMILSML